MIAVEAPARRGISSFPALNQPCALPSGQKIRRFYCVSFFFPPFSLVPKGGKIRLHIIIRWKFGEDERAKFRIERERRRLFVEKSNRFALYVRFLRFWLIASEADVAEINWWIKRRGLKLIRGGKYSYVEVHIGIMESAWKVLETSSLDKLSCETRFSRVCAATCAVCIRRSWLSTNRVRPPTNGEDTSILSRTIHRYRDFQSCPSRASIVVFLTGRKWFWKSYLSKLKFCEAYLLNEGKSCTISNLGILRI